MAEEAVEGKVIVIADRVLVNGLRMAGIHDYVYCDDQEFEKELLGTMKRSDASIVITTNRLLNKVSWRTKQLVENTAKPIVIGVSDLSGEQEEGESLAWMIKRALGFDLFAEDNSKENKQ